MQPLRLSSVGFPLPEGPAIARNTLSLMLWSRRGAPNHLFAKGGILRNVDAAGQGTSNSDMVSGNGYSVTRGMCILGYRFLTSCAKMPDRIVAGWFLQALAFVGSVAARAEGGQAPADDAVAVSP